MTEGTDGALPELRTETTPCSMRDVIGRKSGARAVSRAPAAGAAVLGLAVVVCASAAAMPAQVTIAAKRPAHNTRNMELSPMSQVPLICQR